MILWVNGPFGSGKSTLVDELRTRLPDALVFDPEHIGYVLREIVEVPTGDFQDLPMWRREVASFAVGPVQDYGRLLLVPMTLVRPEYLVEIFGAIEAAGVGVHHVFLDAPREVIEQRIDGRSFYPDDPTQDVRVRAWCKARVDACRAAVDALPAGTVVLDATQTPQQLAEAALAVIGPIGSRSSG
ncbi:AAA family ATPase [Allorhizocola rhizosphaerae]|uniref:AAA family ATPase n=1 Tax=Allorhizocola rhizosphaerae TaxID=1872709 RepID=UPI000E3BFA2E|nr:AAA family ATPase [Allorhizocola rhizosphaerae]